MLTCDVCGNTKDIKTWTFGLDGKAYEIDLCPKDGNGLSKVTAGYTSNARKAGAGHTSRRDGHRPRPKNAAAGRRDGARAAVKSSGRGRASGSKQQQSNASRPQSPAGKASGPNAKTRGSGERSASRARPGKAGAASRQPANPTGGQPEKGIYVYGILPADIEVAGQTPGVGKPPGPLRVVRCNGLAALISEVGPAARLGSPDDLGTHRAILDATATEVPVLPLRFGTVVASEDAVTRELLAAHHDEFAAALKQLEGRAQFLAKGRYVRGGLGEISGEAVAATRKEDTQALQRAMESVCLASVVHEPAHELDAVDVAFLVPVDQQSEVERVIEHLAQEWEGRMEVRLLGPMAAYDFAGTAKPQA
jgi:hypothetical protein